MRNEEKIWRDLASVLQKLRVETATRRTEVLMVKVECCPVVEQQVELLELLGVLRAHRRIRHCRSPTAALRPSSRCPVVSAVHRQCRSAVVAVAAAGSVLLVVPVVLVDLVVVKAEKVKTMPVT